jgi:hypothetical protein
MNFDNVEYTNKLKYANECLGICDDLNIEKNRNIVFIYSPPKVGSTTLVSSIRLSAAHKFTVHHIHNEIMLKVLYNITNITVLEIIKYNNFLGKRVYVFDIFRSPIEQKMSSYFENIDTFHFNSPNDVINTTYDVSRVIKRFNKLFPHLPTNDHYKTNYGIMTTPASFNFIGAERVIEHGTLVKFSEKNYLLQDIDGIKYIKLRLKDSSEWSKILSEILETEILIVNDYETDKKPIKDMYSKFKNAYRIPLNLYKMIENCESLKYYYSAEERQMYLDTWRSKICPEEFTTYTADEFKFYTELTLDNQYMTEIQREHYIDMGCVCLGCSAKRKKMFIQLKNGGQINEKINHEAAKIEYLKDNIKKAPIIIRKIGRPPNKFKAKSILTNTFSLTMGK